jgi:hypothetical protein
VQLVVSSLHGGRVGGGGGGRQTLTSTMQGVGSVVGGGVTTGGRSCPGPPVPHPVPQWKRPWGYPDV